MSLMKTVSRVTEERKEEEQVSCETSTKIPWCNSKLWAAENYQGDFIVPISIGELLFFSQVNKLKVIHATCGATQLLAWKVYTAGTQLCCHTDSCSAEWVGTVKFRGATTVVTTSEVFLPLKKAGLYRLLGSICDQLPSSLVNIKPYVLQYFSL